MSYYYNHASLRYYETGVANLRITGVMLKAQGYVAS
jgi:hypothetical protein